MASLFFRTSPWSPETISYQAQIASMVLALCYARLQPCFVEQAGAQIRALSRLIQVSMSCRELAVNLGHTAWSLSFLGG